ncbi:putative leader peptide [Umezawaea beigongshangensis]|uniref:putative leader peptide n=1 Tax=Umezawaea beigongshangensis TaxID=2780383 RepID=UPI0034D3DE2C
MRTRWSRSRRRRARCSARAAVRDVADGLPDRTRIEGTGPPPADRVVPRRAVRSTAPSTVDRGGARRGLVTPSEQRGEHPSTPAARDRGWFHTSGPTRRCRTPARIHDPRRADRPLTSSRGAPRLGAVRDDELLVARLHVDLRRQASAICRIR